MDKAPSSRNRILDLIRATGFIASAFAASALSLSHEDALRIGRKIWQNECNGSIARLTSWNEGENFASLGIGHFIWYPKNARDRFEESFPQMVAFVSSRGAKLPEFVRDAPCPWNSRAEFLHAQSSPQMKQLREFLASTVDLQAEFLVHRLQDSLPKMLAATAPEGRAHVQQMFDRLAQSPRGTYALIDYVNFKGDGTLESERYQGQGWGLLQVLETASDDGDATHAFAAAAKKVLQQRVRLSPPAHHEARWLPGWENRIDSYARD